MLDENSYERNYVLGRIFAVVEYASADSHFSRHRNACMSNPCPNLIEQLKAYESFSTSQKTKVTELYSTLLNKLDIPDAFPRFMSPDEQGLFALGYYHQKADLYN